MRVNVKALLLCILLLMATESCYGSQPKEHFSKTDYSYRAFDIETLAGGFEHPPTEAGPWVYWFCFDNAITAEEMEREIKEMVSVGIAGAELRFVEFAWWRDKDIVDKELAMTNHNRLEYLSEQFLEVLEHACYVAEKYGFKLAINMGMGWPPGGTWITDKYRTRRLESKTTIVEGPKQLGQEQEVTVKPDGRVLAWRLKEGKEKSVQPDSFVNLTGHVRTAGKEGHLFWKVPEGKWLISVFRLGYGGGLDKAYGYPADPGSKDAIKFHLNYLLDKIEPKLGKYFGTTLTEVASDSWEYDGRPYWTPGIDEMFLKLHGYELLPHMYALAGYSDDREKIIADVKRAQQKLVLQNFYINAREILNAHGLCHRPQAYGRGLSRDLFEVYSNCDVPEIEEGVRLPQAVWVTHTLGKPIASVEAMTFLSRHGNNLISLGIGEQKKEYGLDEPREPWETNPAMLRWFSNAHFARGINRVQIHSFSYSPEGLPLPGWRMYAQIHLNRNVPWFRFLKQYSTWAKRIQWVLQSGWPVADVLVYPVQSNPPDGPYGKQAEHQPVSAINCVDAASTYTFSRIWESGNNLYEVRNLCLLGDIKTIEGAKKLNQMLNRGATVTYCGVEPQRWTVFEKHEGKTVEKLFRFIKGARQDGKIIDGREEGWQKVLKKARSVRWYPENAALTYLHRRVKGAEIYFVMNCGRQFDGEVEFSETGLIPQLWDADTGKRTVCGQWKADDGKVRVKLSLGRLDSAIIVFTKAQQTLHARDCKGADIIRDEDGNLYALISEGKSCRVFLSDGTVRDIIAGAPKEIQLNDRWILRAGDSNGVGIKGNVKLTIDTLKSWRKINQLRNYSGTGIYRIPFDVRSGMLRDDLLVELDLGKVYEVAEVWLNGERVGVSWYPPHRIDISEYLRHGKNELRIDVVNILKNYLAKQGYSHPSGLLGPVKILGIPKVSLNE